MIEVGEFQNFFNDTFSGEEINKSNLSYDIKQSVKTNAEANNPPTDIYQEPVKDFTIRHNDSFV